MVMNLTNSAHIILHKQPGYYSLYFSLVLVSCNLFFSNLSTLRGWEGGKWIYHRRDCIKRLLFFSFFSPPPHLSNLYAVGGGEKKPSNLFRIHPFSFKVIPFLVLLVFSPSLDALSFERKGIHYKHNNILSTNSLAHTNATKVTNHPV